MTRDDLMQPRNASELAYLTTPTAGTPTLAARREALAFMHVRGLTLPDTTATAASCAAWANRNAPPQAVVAPPPPMRSAPAIQPFVQPPSAPKPQQDLLSWSAKPSMASESWCLTFDGMRSPPPAPKKPSAWWPLSASGAKRS